MKTLTKNTTQPRSQTMREIADGYRPGRAIRYAIQIHNNPSILLAIVAVCAVLTFVAMACPALGANILHDLVAKW
jgi:hypothetical protein